MVRSDIASRIMRTTIDIDDPILDEVRQLQRREGKPLGRLVSDLLARALSEERSKAAGQAPPFRWVSRPMGARIDLADKHAVLDAMDEHPR